MGALRQHRLSENTASLRKPPQAETKTISCLEKLRAQSNYKADTGYSPLYHAMLAELPRLMASLVGVWILEHVLRLSLGQKVAGGRQQWSIPTSSEEYAELCCANVRDIQRQISEMKDRGIIGVRIIKTGVTIKYSMRLMLERWPELEPYAVWKRRQVVAIDESPADETVDDEAPAAISKDAVVVSKPKRIAPGRASKAAKVEGGVTEFLIQNDSDCDVVGSSVLQSGRLVAIIKASGKATGELKAKTQCSPEVTSEKGEDKGNVARHGCRGVPANEGIPIPPQVLTVDHPRAAELIKIFDPLLAAGHVALLSSDLSSLSSACSAIQDCDHNYLVKFAMQRAARKFGSPRSVVPVCVEALASERASKVLDGAGLPVMDGKKKGFVDGVKEAAARRLQKYGRI